MDSRDASGKPQDLVAYLGEIDRFERIIETWDQEARATVEFYRQAIDEFHRDGLRRLIGAINADAAARVTLRQSVDDPVVYAMLRHHGLLKPSIGERVEAALASVRPLLAEHGGDVELVSIEHPAVELRFTGACDGCPASALTFREAVTRAVQSACPEITDVRQAKR